MRRSALVLVAALALGPSAAQAHHSLAGYDSSRPMQLDGVVTEFRYAHPHPFLIIRATGDKLWKLEMDNLYELDEIGFTKTSFKPGDRVQVRADPARDRPGDAYLRRLDRPSDGLRYEQVGYSPKVNQRPR